VRAYLNRAVACVLHHQSVRSSACIERVLAIVYEEFTRCHVICHLD
jgi:hypothetical protein